MLKELITLISNMFKTPEQLGYIPPQATPEAPKVEVPVEVPLEIKWDPSPNFSIRHTGKNITAVILHHTAGSLEGTVSWFKSKDSQVSAHYVIAKDGTIYQMVEEKYRAWHAGGLGAQLEGETDVNSISIGIEMVGDGKAPFTDAQYVMTARLVKELKKKYNIVDSRIVGHKDLTPLKVDPCPWEKERFFNLVNS